MYLCKKIALIFSLLKAIFLLIFCFAISKVVHQYSTGTVIKNPEMLMFVPDHLKTKKMCKHAVKNYLS